MGNSLLLRSFLLLRFHTLRNNEVGFMTLLPHITNYILHIHSILLISIGVVFRTAGVCVQMLPFNGEDA